MPAKKYIGLNAQGTQIELAAIVVSDGAANDGDLAALNAQGKLDASVLPIGIGSDTQSAIASEAIAAGQLVNFWNNAGTTNARLADASAASASRIAHGYATAAVASLASGSFSKEGTVTGVAGLTIGAPVFLAAVAGGVTPTAITASGHSLQFVGVATSATTFDFEPDTPIIRA
jgi:hypothetical protein